MPHRPNCLVPGHDAVLSGSMLLTLNKYAASISKVEHKDDVFVPIFCRNPQIQADISTRTMCFAVIHPRDAFTCSVAQPTPPHPGNSNPPHDVYSLSRAVTLGDPLFIQNATQLCQRSCRIVAAQSTASGERLKVDVSASIYTKQDTQVNRNYAASLQEGLWFLFCLYRLTEVSCEVCLSLSLDVFTGTFMLLTLSTLNTHCTLWPADIIAFTNLLTPWNRVLLEKLTSCRS
jgi:hypothetical protein